MTDLVYNIRSMLVALPAQMCIRDRTYTALKQYEKIGPMASPFINDPTAIVARAFSELYPGVEYVAPVSYTHLAVRSEGVEQDQAHR